MTQAQDILSTRQKEILQIILDRSLHDAESNLIPKFRLEFLNDREILDHFTNSQLVRKNNDQTQYIPSLVGMYLTNSDLSNKVFSDIDRICDVMRAHYEEKYDAPIAIEDIKTQVNMDKKYLVFCLDMLCEGVGMGRTANMMDDGSEIQPSENLFDFKRYSEIPEGFLPLWFPDKFDTVDTAKKPGVTEANATKREELLGAAVAVIANFPKECTWGKSIVGKRVYNLIHAKAKTWWTDGDVPLKEETGIELINKYLKTLE